MDCSTPDFPVLHHLPGSAQIHLHWVDDAIQPFHPLLSPSPPALNLPQHHGLFQWVSSLHQMVKSIEASVSASVLPMNIQSWFPLRCTGLIFLLSKGLSRVFSSTTVWRHQFFRHSAFFIVQLSHPYMTTGKTTVLTTWTFVGKVMSLLLNMRPRFVIAILPRSTHLLVLWLQSPSTVILESKKINLSPVLLFLYLFKVMAVDTIILVFWMLSFKSTFSLTSFTFIKSSLVPFCFLP